MSELFLNEPFEQLSVKMLENSLEKKDFSDFLPPKVAYLGNFIC
jgi:hypothetical protein